FGLAHGRDAGPGAPDILAAAATTTPPALAAALRGRGALTGIRFDPLVLHAVAQAFHVLECVARGGLLGLFLVVAAPLAQRAAADHDLDHEVLGVVGS